MPAWIAGAAGDDLHVANALQEAIGVHAEDVRQECPSCDAPFERVGDRARLLEDLLEHVVAVFAALDRVGRQLARMHAALDARAIGVVNRNAASRDFDEVAFLEIAELVG